jgi:type IV pilus assembly protein PilN
MRISVNLATRPFADLGPALRRLRIAMGALAVAALGLWLGLHLLHGRADKVRAQERTLDASITKYNQERQVYRNLVAQPQNSAIIDQAAALNALIDKKGFSWTLAMEDLETVLPGGVQVTTLEPIVDKKDGHVSVRLRVVGPRDKSVDLVANLEHSRRFLQPRIIGESTETTAGSNPNAPMEPVSASTRETFELLADYNPATPAEREQMKKAKHTEAAAATAEDVNQNPVPEQPAAPARRVAPPGNRAMPPAHSFPANPQGARRPFTAAPQQQMHPVVQDSPLQPPQAYRGGPR